MTEPIGAFCLVLHSHLPWLAGHGSWPVGEEWLHQAWAHCYLPLAGMLERFAAEGRRDVLTLGITPSLAAGLDDPRCLRSFHHWLGNWRLRSHEAAARWRGDPVLRELAAAEHRAAGERLAEFGARWRHGASPVLRPLIESGTVELLGGPATHPFQPMLEPEMRDFALQIGLNDAELRWGVRPDGIWAPECAHRPGMEREYAAAGVRRFLVDGGALEDVSVAHPVGGDVLCFGRDVALSEEVWSATGYPAHSDYRDFHTFDHAVGLKPARITGRDVDPGDKEPYDPARAAAAVDGHAREFVSAVTNRLAQRGGLVVAAFDTELFGHWWFEGPSWLEKVLRALPAAGVRVTTLRGAVQAGHVGAPVQLPETSWGVGNDWRTWCGDAVSDIAEANRALQERALRHLRRVPGSAARDPVRDQLLREVLLALASDWAFMISHETGADYARGRARLHAARAHRLVDLVERGAHAEAAEFARGLRSQDGIFGHLDARSLR
ncbi:glycoside hydrolase family 57 protein [Saccharopolyspora sp. HNM0986]|uniref:1,4-alpha-glucan branching protein domain-containing protein n=1 Tax=Saccharopolyspora galaxeae TaxID=2781241 RepID=UPI00190BAC2C|nr:glycoside hydrolase family 57 protein [Saccharopolyspora sp. HNM0986]MBK0867597.1 glycoside hydrolase family 57 protein [Saccharopolyspora sp. HNM0986]